MAPLLLLSAAPRAALPASRVPAKGSPMLTSVPLHPASGSRSRGSLVSAAQQPVCCGARSGVSLARCGASPADRAALTSDATMRDVAGREWRIATNAPAGLPFFVKKPVISFADRCARRGTAHPAIPSIPTVQAPFPSGTVAAASEHSGVAATATAVTTVCATAKGCAHAPRTSGSVARQRNQTEATRGGGASIVEGHNAAALLRMIGQVPCLTFIRPKNGRFPAMPQVEGQFVQLANEAAAMERAAMERATAPESPGGRDITEAELIDIRSHRRHRLHWSYCFTMPRSIKSCSSVPKNS